MCFSPWRFSLFPPLFGNKLSPSPLNNKVPLREQRQQRRWRRRRSWCALWVHRQQSWFDSANVSCALHPRTQPLRYHKSPSYGAGRSSGWSWEPAARVHSKTRIYIIFHVTSAQEGKQSLLPVTWGWWRCNYVQWISPSLGTGGVLTNVYGHMTTPKSRYRTVPSSFPFLERNINGSHGMWSFEQLLPFSMIYLRFICATAFINSSHFFLMSLSLHGYISFPLYQVKETWVVSSFW